ncbi:hypothetical protein pb186bvf_018307 [Paramecium bursaria]
MYYLQWIDQFGVPLTMKTFHGEKIFKSVFGGVITILIYAVSIAYLIFVLVQWTNGHIAPKISTKDSPLVYANQTFKVGTIAFGLLNQTDDEIDPFSETNNIITPFILEYRGVGVTNYVPLFTDQKEVKYQSDHIFYGSKTIISPIDQYLQFGFGDFVSFMVIFKACEQQYLKEGQYCASQEIIDEYISREQGVIQLSIQLEQYDALKKSTDLIYESYYLAFTPSMPQYNQIFFQNANLKVNDGILFENINEKNYISKFSLITQSVGQNFYSKMIGDGSLVGFIFGIDKIQQSILVTEPNLGEVLAQVGSIVQILFLLQYLAQGYNEHYLEENLIKDIIRILYPQFNDYKIKFNLSGSIKKVISMKGQEINIQQFKEQYIKLKYESLQWLSLLHVIKEINLLKNQILNEEIESRRFIDIPQDEKIIVGDLRSIVNKR